MYLSKQIRKDVRKRHNFVDKLSVNGVVLAHHEGLEEAVVQFYKELYSEQQKVRPFPSEVRFQTLNEGRWGGLVASFSREEVWGVVKSCAAEKAPGPDGFCFAFLQRCWSFVGEDFVRALDEFFHSGTLPRMICHTFICLIPKKEDVEDIKDLRPISLVGCIYKVISKVLMERLKLGISEVISENQCAFIGGRQILDASLIVNEVIDSRKRSGRAGLVFKLDIEKAYDHVNWGCLIQTLEAMNFPPRWVDWMWSCISSPFFSVLVNGESKGYFKSERGLRQGDSLSPFLFTCVMEVLSGMFRVVRGAGLFSGFFMDEANRRGEVSHVLYADDTIVFCEADEQQVKVLLATLVCFETVSGLRVNYHKSCMFPVGEVANALRFADLFGCGVGSFPSTYLGLPLGAYAKSKALWDPVVSCVTKRLSSWKARLMSFGGRLTLVKSVLSCLPIYYMSLFKAPASVIKQIERMQCRFLWEGVSEVRKLHLVRWDLVKAPLARGGLGILDLSCMNSALLNKWSWRFGTERVAWWRRLVTLKCREDKSSWVANWNLLSSGWSVWRWIVLECAWFWKFGHIDP
ncbi:LINE-1 retrotransposable element ORF2 protein, partial [Linum perenne]